MADNGRHQKLDSNFKMAWERKTTKTFEDSISVKNIKNVLYDSCSKRSPVKSASKSSGDTASGRTNCKDSETRVGSDELDAGGHGYRCIWTARGPRRLKTQRPNEEDAIQELHDPVAKPITPAQVSSFRRGLRGSKQARCLEQLQTNGAGIRITIGMNIDTTTTSTMTINHTPAQPPAPRQRPPQFICEYCHLATFVREKSYQYHLLRCHLDTTAHKTTPYYCHVCINKNETMRFAEKEAFLKHMETHGASRKMKEERKLRKLAKKSSDATSWIVGKEKWTTNEPKRKKRGVDSLKETILDVIGTALSGTTMVSPSTIMVVDEKPLATTGTSTSPLKTEHNSSEDAARESTRAWSMVVKEELQNVEECQEQNPIISETCGDKFVEPKTEKF